MGGGGVEGFSQTLAPPPFRWSAEGGRGFLERPLIQKPSKPAGGGSRVSAKPFPPPPQGGLGGGVERFSQTLRTVTDWGVEGSGRSQWNPHPFDLSTCQVEKGEGFHVKISSQRE